MKRKAGQHCVEAIHNDFEGLDQEQLLHIEGCSRCRTEYEVYRRLEQAVRNLPTLEMPEGLRNQILNQVLLPGYRMSHLMVALILACLTPLMLLLFDVRTLFGPGLTLSLYGGSGILIALLMLPITHYLLLRHRLDVDFLKSRIDELLEKRAF